MSAETGTDAVPTDATDVRTPIAHHFRGGFFPVTSTCGFRVIKTPEEWDGHAAPDDAERCLVCLDLLTH